MSDCPKRRAAARCLRDRLLRSPACPELAPRGVVKFLIGEATGARCLAAGLFGRGLLGHGFLGRRLLALRHGCLLRLERAIISPVRRQAVTPVTAFKRCTRRRRRGTNPRSHLYGYFGLGCMRHCKRSGPSSPLGTSGRARQLWAAGAPGAQGMKTAEPDGVRFWAALPAGIRRARRVATELPCASPTLEGMVSGADRKAGEDES